MRVRSNSRLNVFFAVCLFSLLVGHSAQAQPPQPQYKVWKSVDPKIYSTGDTVTYYIRVENVGAILGTNTYARDEVSSRLEYQGAIPAPIPPLPPPTLEWSLGNLMDGSSWGAEWSATIWDLPVGTPPSVEVLDNYVTVGDANGNIIISENAPITICHGYFYEYFEEEMQANSVCAADWDDVWYVGDKGEVVHFDGFDYTVVDPPPTSVNFNDVTCCGGGTSDFVSVGNNGTVFWNRDGTGWVEDFDHPANPSITGGKSVHLRSAHADCDSGEIWVGGFHGFLMHYYESSPGVWEWKEIITTFTEHI